MLEVEIKFPITDRASVEAAVLGLGGRVAQRRQEEDHYFNAPDRDFAATDEAFRLRQVGNANFVTYKGPKLDRQTKTRTEIEVPLAHGRESAERFMQLLEHLGYRRTAVVRKERHTFHLEAHGFRVEVSLDDVEGLGLFVETEIVVPEDQVDAARAAVTEIAGQLGLANSERRSYLELLLSRRAETSS